MQSFGLSAVMIGMIATSAQAQGYEVGEEIYSRYCATCHGEAATGNGPLAQYLVQSVPDLTILTERNRGIFPMLRVLEAIDAGSRLPGHGGPMPVFGALFMDEIAGAYGQAAGQIETRGRILSLAIYLRSIQKDGG